jgi:hypothetical protein
MGKSGSDLSHLLRSPRQPQEEEKIPFREDDEDDFEFPEPLSNINETPQ